MKRFVIISSILLLALATQAQDTTVYRSVLGDTLSEWYDYAELADGNATTLASQAVVTDTFEYNGLYYHPFVFLHLDCSRTSLFWDVNYVCNGNIYIRESINNDKLFLLYRNINDVFQEITVMDMNLKAGDTVPCMDKAKLLFPESKVAGQTILIDTVFYSDGRKIQVTNYIYHSTYHDDTLIFIEGIGPNLGLMFQMVNNSVDRLFMRCFDKDSVLEYHSYQMDEKTLYNGMCFYGVHAENIKPSADGNINVYPNPSHHYINIDNLQEGKWQITLATMDGATLLTKSNVRGQCTLDISNYSQGIYILKAVSDGKILTNKVIKL